MLLSIRDHKHKPLRAWQHFYKVVVNLGKKILTFINLEIKVTEKHELNHNSFDKDRLKTASYHFPKNSANVSASMPVKENKKSIVQESGAIFHDIRVYIA